jgi:CelD/BcsL family acetyltransferase involved in cellulose biosynthesis
MDAPGPAFAGFPFQARDYLEAWLATIGAARRVRPVLVRVDGSNGAPWLLVPLGIERRRGLRVLGFLDGGVVDYAAPIVFPANAPLEPVEPRALWRAIFAASPRFDIANIEKLAAHVNGCINPLFLSDARFASHCGYSVELSGDWPSFAKQRLPGKKHTSRYRRRLSEKGDLRFVIAATPAERSLVLDALIRQKTRKYLETRGVDGFDRPGYRAYFTTLTERFAPLGFVHLSALTLDGAPLATHWGLVSGGRFYYLMPAMESGDWRRFAPGNLLAEDLIQWCYANGLTAFDLGVGDEPYKKDYQPETLRLVRLVMGRSVLGQAIVPALRTLRLLRTRRRAPASAA